MRSHPYLLLAALSCRTRSPDALFVAAASSPLEVAEGAGNVALADLNGDRHLDLVVGTASKNALGILWGDGRGGFASAPRATIDLESPPGEMVIADLNHDSSLDLVIASHDSYGVVVLLGDGQGDFSPAPGSPVVAVRGSTPHNHGLLVADTNEDGHPDLVTVQSEDANVAVLLGDGSGRFESASGSPFAVGPSPYPPALGDVDGDGHVDIAVPEPGMGEYYREHRKLARTVTLLLGNGDGTFHPAASSPLAVGEGPYFAALGDLDGDRDLDLLTTHDDSDLVSVLLNDGRGGFSASPQSPFALGRRAAGACIVDVNRDGRIDAVLATGDSLTLLLGDGRGGLHPAVGSPFSAGRGVWRLAIGDVDEDGRLDVAAANVESRGVTLFLGR